MTIGVLYLIAALLGVVGLVAGWLDRANREQKELKEIAAAYLRGVNDERKHSEQIRRRLLEQHRIELQDAYDEEARGERTQH